MTLPPNNDNPKNLPTPNNLLPLLLSPKLATQLPINGTNAKIKLVSNNPKKFLQKPLLMPYLYYCKKRCIKKRDCLLTIMNKCLYKKRLKNYYCITKRALVSAIKDLIIFGNKYFSRD